MSKLNPLALAIGAAVVSSSLSLSALAANPFQATDLSSGYQLVDAGNKDAEGKCGGEKKDTEAKCGGDKKDATVKDSDMKKDTEAKCGSDKKDTPVNDNDMKKDTEGKCGSKG